MKTEVRFKDEWRMFHILKSSFEESLEPILKTIPDLEKPNFSNQFNFDTIPNRYSDPESSQKNLLFGDIKHLSLVAHFQALILRCLIALQ